MYSNEASGYGENLVQNGKETGIITVESSSENLRHKIKRPQAPPTMKEAQGHADQLL